MSSSSSSGLGPSRLYSSGTPYTLTDSSPGTQAVSRGQPHQPDSINSDSSFSLIATIGDTLRSIRNWFIKKWDAIISYFFPSVPAEYDHDNLDVDPLKPRSDSTRRQPQATHPIANSASQPFSSSKPAPQIDADPSSSDSDVSPFEDVISDEKELPAPLSQDQLEIRRCGQLQELMEYFEDSNMDLNKLEQYCPAGHKQDTEDLFPIDRQDWHSLDLSNFEKPTYFIITTEGLLEAQAIVWPISILELSKDSNACWEKSYILIENHLNGKNPSLNWACSVSNDSKGSVSLDWVLTLAKRRRQEDDNGNQYKLNAS
jgi:hypothetical protein